MRQEPEAGQEQERWAALLRRIDEGGRGASEDGEMDVPGRDTQLWTSWVGANGARWERAFVKVGESDGRWRQKEYYEIGRDEKMKENCRVVEVLHGTENGQIWEKVEVIAKGL